MSTTKEKAQQHDCPECRGQGHVSDDDTRNCSYCNGTGQQQAQPTPGHCWLWPDHTIGKQESRQLREEHNACVNQCTEMAEALRALMGRIEGLLGSEQETAEIWRKVGFEFRQAEAALRKAGRLA